MVGYLFPPCRLLFLPNVYVSFLFFVSFASSIVSTIQNIFETSVHATKYTTATTHLSVLGRAQLASLLT